MTTWFGVDVATVSQTLVDLGRRDRRDAIMAADAALRERIVTVDEVERLLATCSRWPGIRQAREVLRLADARAESPLESLVRLALHDDGFPPPKPQAWIGPDRVDFYWPQYRLVVEADGRVKYTAEELWGEKRREQRIRARGNRVERITWSEVVDTWADTSAVLESAMR